MNSDRWLQPFMARVSRGPTVAERSIVEIVPPKDSIFLIDRVASDAAGGTFMIFSPATLITTASSAYFAQTTNPVNIITVGVAGTTTVAVPATAMLVSALETYTPHAWIMHSMYGGRLAIIASAVNVIMNVDIVGRMVPQDYPLDLILAQV